MIDRLTGPARRVLDLAGEEAGRFGHRYVGPEHVVLGMLRDGTSAAAQILRRRLLAYVGLPGDYRGAAGQLLEAFGVEPDQLRDARVAHLRGVPR